ncbi:MAG: hypothetical protein ACI9MC_001550 [Kiritimatiellia bacterium]|jgi:hypothetical protein
MLFLVSALMATPAQAADSPSLDVEVQMTALRGDSGFGNTLSARANSKSDVYVVIDGRFHTDGRALGRVGAGVDLLGGGAANLTVGGFAGAAGDWRTHELLTRPQVGAELGLGYSGRRLGAMYRWRVGYGDGPLRDVLTENELTVSYRVIEELRLVGQFMRLDPGEQAKETTVGLGVSYTF